MVVPRDLTSLSPNMIDTLQQVLPSTPLNASTVFVLKTICNISISYFILTSC
jgi:hypothetical protein